VCRGSPDRVNYNTRFPLPEGSRDCFSDDVVRAIHVSVIDRTPISSPEEAALNALAGVVLLVADRLIVQETALAG
jgi:hypothetical protein